MLPGARGGMMGTAPQRGAWALAVLCAISVLLSGCKQPTPDIEPVVVRATPVVPVKRLDPLFDDVQKRTFNFFWETAEPGTGLMPDRWPRPPFCSIAAVGF